MGEDAGGPSAPAPEAKKEGGAGGKKDFATAILDRKKSPNRLVVEDALNDENSVVALSTATMEELQVRSLGTSGGSRACLPPSPSPPPPARQRARACPPPRA